jgi:hypothetical protein
MVTLFSSDGEIAAVGALPVQGGTILTFSLKTDETRLDGNGRLLCFLVYS